MQNTDRGSLLFRMLGSWWFVFLGALFSALAYLAVAAGDISSIQTQQRVQLIEMTNSFVEVFSQERGQGAPVPATFRRMGIEHFTSANNGPEDWVRKTVRMPGRPGLEMRTTATDARTREIIESFVSDSPPVLNEHRIVNDRLIASSYFPSIASNENCVTCHNAALGEGTYRLGDVMGAFVVESDLTEAAWRHLGISCLVFVFGLCASGLLAIGERRRTRDTIAALQAKVRLEEEKVAAETQSNFLLSHDALTGLANRSMFKDRLDNDLWTAQPADIIVAIIDLDEFKAVNDSLGHAAGDALLSEVAKRLSYLLEKENALTARLGGDEFAVVLRVSTRFSTPDALGAAIMDAMKPPYRFERAVVQPRCCIGLAAIEAVDEKTTSDFLKAADAALYEAKASGKSTFRVFDDLIRASLGRRSLIAKELGPALADDRLRIVLQPKLYIETGRFAGFEALTRWQLNGEEVAPDEFVKVAEQAGLIRQLDMLTLEKAANFAVAQEARTGLAVPISVNLSAMNLRGDGILSEISEILRSTGLAPDRLTVEVTETAAVQDWQVVQTVFARLRKMGVQVSLDDFGTGYSSLSYLREFGFDEIKIDRSFITDIVEVEETQVLVGNIITLANGVGSRVVIEGIETEEQAKVAMEMGGKVGQGYLYSRPLELDQAVGFLSDCPASAA